MQPLRAYHPQKYPPLGPRWEQFGDDIMGSATDEMRAMITRKNQWKREFHVGRLKEHGMLPPAHRDPEDDVMDGFDLPEPSAPPLPPPPRPPSPPQKRRMMEPVGKSHTIYEPEHFDIGYDTADDGQLPAPSSTGIASAISKGASDGANSLAASLGAGAVHAVTYIGAAGATAVVKGVVNGLSHFATGVNPLSVPDDNEEEPDRSAEPLRPFPKAKAKAKAKSSPHPYPAPFVPVAPYNGGVFDVSSEEEAPGPAAAARRPRNRGGLANRDLEFARRTLAADPGLGRRRG